MTVCEECGDEVVRRVTCPRCSKLVCPHCLHHNHSVFVHGSKPHQEPQMNRNEIEGELDDSEIEMQVSSATLAKLDADKKVAAARAAAEQARLAVEAAEKAAEAAVAEAERLAREAENELYAAQALAQERLDEEARAAKDAQRPERVEWEIEVLEVWNYSKETKAIEFVVHGAPNLASYRGASPVLRAFVCMARRSWEFDPHTYYPFNDVKETKRMGPGKGYRDSSLVRHEEPPEMPRVHVPRSAHLDRFFETNVQAPGTLTHEMIETACRRVFAEHLDMVDAERIRRGDPEVDRSFMGQKITVRT